MTRRPHPQDELERVVRLLESLRSADPALVFDVEPAVARRLRALPRPLSWGPVVSFREFLLGAAASFALALLGGVGLIAAFSPEWLSSPSTALEGMRNLASRALSALDSLAWAIGHGLLERLGAAAPYLDASLAAASQAAVVLCAAMFALTFLVVAHEARRRRTAE